MLLFIFCQEKGGAFYKAPLKSTKKEHKAVTADYRKSEVNFHSPFSFTKVRSAFPASS